MAVLVAVIVLGVVTAVTALSPRTPFAQTIGDLGILLACLAATFSCWRAARRGGPTARAWWMLSIASGVWSAGQLVWTWYGVTADHVYPFPSLADAGFLVYSVPAVIGLLLFPRATKRQFSGSRAVLDALVVALSLLFVSWSTVLGPLAAAGGSGLTRVVSLAYPIVDVVVGSLVITLGMRAPAGGRRSWLLLGSGLLLLAVTDSVYVSETVQGLTGSTGTPLAVGWMSAFLLIAFAATTRPTRSDAQAPHFTVLQELLAFLPALAAVAIASLHSFDARDAFLDVNGALVLLVLAAQQVVVAFEKVRLANGLEGTVAARTLELRGAQDRFGSLVESSDEAIFVKTLDGIITSWNPAAERLYGFSAEEIVGQSINALVPPGLRDEEQDIRRRVTAGEQLRSLETERLHKDGSRIPVAVTVSPILENGVVTGLSAIGHDITDRKRHEAELTEARTRAVEASRAKSEFLATMSHEIRTPMNGVIGLTGLLLDTELDEVQRKYASGVRGAGQALLGIIDDILDFSKLEAGKVELEVAPFDPEKLVEEVGVLMKAAGDGKQLELVAFCDGDVPEVVSGDAGRLRQVLINLASNAIKFTAAGEVVLRIQLRLIEAKRCVLEFSVRDTGIGIDMADQERLFEPFSQADASTTRRFGGTGLGLAISRRLVDAMGGELGMDSEVGVGSIFRFSVPLTLASHPPTPRSRLVRLQGLNVLVVDDNATNRLILENQLTAWDVRVDVADAAPAGWALMQAAAADGRPYDIAILDMCMPDVDGLELSGWIGAEPSMATTRVMILSSGGPLDALELANAGVRACVSKPIRASELHDALMQLSAAATTPDEAIEPAPAAVVPALLGRVLVVEDNPVNQMVAEGMLRSLGYQVDLADDGLKALKALSGNSYAAVLMDCHMPQMDGFEATKRLRRSEAGARRTPVIAMTAGVLAQDRQRCTAAGMDDFVAKPVDVELLRVVLAQWTSEVSAEQPVIEDDVLDDRLDDDILDDGRLAILRGIGPADGWGVLPAIIEAFVRSAPAEALALQAASDDGDAAAVESLLHRLRGAAANLGAGRLAQTCGDLEAALHGGAAVDAAALGGVQRALSDACEALDGLILAKT